MTDSQRIDPEKISAPFQLLAAALVFIVLLDGSFLSAAAVINRPHWASGLLVVASVLNVPLLLLGTFLLATRFRPQMLADEHYLQWRIFVQWSTLQLKQSNDAAGVDLSAIFLAESQHEAKARHDLYLTKYGRELEYALQDPRRRDALDEDTVASASRELGRASAAQGDWVRAADHFEASLDAAPNDWGTWFALATSLANVRGGNEVNRRAVRAIDRALELVPPTVQSATTLRMKTYRAAVLKRLGEIDESLAQLLAVEPDAKPGTDEGDDIAYNLACVYAIRGDGQNAVRQLRRVHDDRFLIAAAAHRHDYFSSLLDYEPFNKLIADAMTRAEPSVLRDADPHG
jgi:Flp pilus assembly protein TadD